MGTLVDQLESALDEMAISIAKETPGVGRPVIGWDGNSRVWILRRLSTRGLEERPGAYLEAVISLLPDLPSFEEAAETALVSVEARAWVAGDRNLSWSQPQASMRLQNARTAPIQRWLSEAVFAACELGERILRRLPEISEQRQVGDE